MQQVIAMRQIPTGVEVFYADGHGVHLAEGQTVHLNTPDNPRLHGQRVIIDRFEMWGAHVLTSVGSGRYRALWDELRSGEGEEVKQAIDSRRTDVVIDGTQCSTCGSGEFFRAGACLTCSNCGTSQGCS